MYETACDVNRRANGPEYLRPDAVGKLVVRDLGMPRKLLRIPAASVPFLRFSSEYIIKGWADMEQHIPEGEQAELRMMGGVIIAVYANELMASMQVRPFV